jgi:hypothetical protein
VELACHSSYVGGIKRIAVQAGKGKNVRLYWKNNYINGWMCWLTPVIPTMQEALGRRILI